MGQCNFLNLWHQKLYSAFRFGTLWPISCSYRRHSQITRHSLLLANGRIRQSLTALVNTILMSPKQDSWLSQEDLDAGCEHSLVPMDSYGRFLPTTSKKWFFLDFLRQSDDPPPPPPQEESKCKNAQFSQWILKDDDVYYQKITAS